MYELAFQQAGCYALKCMKNAGFVALAGKTTIVSSDSVTLLC